MRIGITLIDLNSAPVFLLALASICAAQPAKRLITETDLYKFRWIADAQISIPEGVTDNVLIVSVVARDVNNQFSLLTGASEKTITVFPKVTSP